MPFTEYHHFRGSAFLPSSKKAKGFRHVPEKAFPDHTSPLDGCPKDGFASPAHGRVLYTRTTEAPSSAFDLSLRPPAFSEFCGQEKIKDRLMLMVEAARQRDDVLDHILLSGPPGLGKTTLANIIANAVGCRIHTTSGPQIEKAGDLAGVLTNLEKGDILFIDEIHRLHPAIEEYLYPAMEDFRLDIIIDQGPNARSIQLNLPKFTLVGGHHPRRDADQPAAFPLRPSEPTGLLYAGGAVRHYRTVRGAAERARGPGGRPADRAALPRHAPRGQFPAALGAGLRPGARRRRDYGAVGARRPDHD